MLRNLALPLTLLALASLPSRGLALGAHPDDLVEPGQFHSEFVSRVRQASTALEEVHRAAARLQEASRSCIAAEGASAACETLDAAHADFFASQERYQAARAQADAWQGHLNDAVGEYEAEGCGPRNWIQSAISLISDVTRRNCESNIERYRGLVSDASTQLAALDKRSDAVTSGVLEQHGLALRHRAAAAHATARQAAAVLASHQEWARNASPAELADRIARCRHSGGDAECQGDLPAYYREVYQRETGITVGADQFPPVRTIEEACAAWGSETRVPPVHGREICEPGALTDLTPEQAREKIIFFLRNGPGRRVGCNPSYERCLATDYDAGGDAQRLATGTEPPAQQAPDETTFAEATDTATAIADRHTDQGAAVASVVGRDPDGPVQCQGGATSTFGLGVECGDRGDLDPAPGATTPPEFIPTNMIGTEPVLGNGARVMRGDTLGHIAQDVRREMGRTDLPLWGPGGLVDLLAAANGTEDPNVLYPSDGVRVPTLECLGEAADTGGTEARQVLKDCEVLVRVEGVPANLTVALRMARERVAELERKRGSPFSDAERQEILQDAANTAASPASEFAGVGPGIPAADFIRLQTERFGDEYRALITQVAADAEARGYNDDERFRLLYRRIREAETD